MSGKIRVCDIEKYYGNKNNLTKAVNRISFQVQNGEFVGIMGSLRLRKDYAPESSGSY